VPAPEARRATRRFSALVNAVDGEREPPHRHRGVNAREVSRAAIDLVRASDVIDLHVDTFIPIRLFGWDLAKRHGLGLLRGHFLGHLDVPRMKEGGLTGAMWSITTNPFRTAIGRWRTFEENLSAIREKLTATGGAIEIVRTLSEYRAVRQRGAHAALLAVQGGNCFDAAPGSARAVAEKLITRVTLVHLTNSLVGTTSAPFSILRSTKGLSDKGRELVRALNEERVFVDLAHIHPDGFWDAVAVHDRTQPLIDTHTGVAGVTPHWRNLDDRQIKAIADTGGTIGIIYAANFLASRGGPKDGGMVVEHMHHIISVAGEDFVSIGSDYDGMITPPVGLRSGESYPRLVQLMLDRGWSDTRIRKILGGNFLRAFGLLRP
jgi:membrane dipeptidase